MAIQSQSTPANIPFEHQSLTIPSKAASTPFGSLLAPPAWDWPDVRRVAILIPAMIPRADRVRQMLASFDLPENTPIAVFEIAARSRANRARQAALAAFVMAIQMDYQAAHQTTLASVGWLGGLHTLLREGDLLVCFSGQRIGDSSSHGPFFSQALFESINLPVLEVEGAMPSMISLVWRWTKRALFDLFPFIVVGLFFWLQSIIGSVSTGWTGKLALGSTVVVEIVLVFAWSLFLSQRHV